MRAGLTNSLLSGRAQDRLNQLQRALTLEIRALNAQQSLLQGALQACDLATQTTVFHEYLERVTVVLDCVVRLRTFVAKHSAEAYMPTHNPLLEPQSGTQVDDHTMLLAEEPHAEA